MLKGVSAGLIDGVVDTVGETVEDVVDILLSCSKCQQNIEAISLKVPETQVYNPQKEAKYENGDLIGCIGVTASLSCNNGSIYNKNPPLKTVELTCQDDQVWVFSSDKSPIEYIDGCSPDQTCFKKVQNNGKLQVNRTSGDTLFIPTNHHNGTYFMIGAADSLMSLVCPSKDQNIFYGESSIQTLNVYCSEKTFNVTQNLPSCYPVKNDELNDPSKNCSGSTGVPFCKHHFVLDETIALSFKINASLQNETETQVATMCIGQGIIFTCINDAESLWVQSSGQSWLALNSTSLRGTCSTVPEAQDYFRLLTNSEGYQRLTNTSKTWSAYTCTDPFLTTSTTIKTSTTTFSTFTTSSIDETFSTSTKEKESSVVESSTSPTTEPSSTSPTTEPSSTTDFDLKTEISSTQSNFLKTTTITPTTTTAATTEGTKTSSSLIPLTTTLSFSTTTPFLETTTSTTPEKITTTTDEKTTSTVGTTFAPSSTTKEKTTLFIATTEPMTDSSTVRTTESLTSSEKTTSITTPTYTSSSESIKGTNSSTKMGPISEEVTTTQIISTTEAQTQTNFKQTTLALTSFQIEKLSTTTSDISYDSTTTLETTSTDTTKSIAPSSTSTAISTTSTPIGGKINKT
ncbi:UNVERIFIED_CONTAM: hypothetical protein RMT77_004067 [Armadillidium vulgare]